MKIAMMVRGYLPVPRPKDIIYAPVDLAIAIGEGLVKRGHTVDFYGPLGTKLETGIVTRNLRPLVHNQKEIGELFGDLGRMSHYVPELWDKYLVTEMFRRANSGEYDLLHFHHPEVALAEASINTKVPVVYTQHDPVFPWYKEIYELYHSPNQYFISISNNQRRDAPDLPYIRTAYNGVDPQHYPYSDNPEDYLLIAGRIVPEKGFKEAIQVAKQTNNRLLIIGPTYPDTQDYFDQYIKPQLDDQILYLGYVDRDQMWRYYQKAKAFLTPVQWEEPFGLTTIEAGACGTPTISLNRGAAPELIIDGKTGYVVDSIAEMATAVEKIDKIHRSDCRDHIKEVFSIEKMVDAYELAFEDVLRKQKQRQSPAQRGKELANKLKNAKLPKKIKAALPHKARTGSASRSKISSEFKEIIQEIANGPAKEPTDLA